MFFEVNDKLGIKFIEEEIRLVPQFDALLKDPELGLKAFDFIVKCFRYNSPYRALPDEQRIKVCAEAAFKQKGKIHALDSEKVALAIDVFNEIQHDSDWEEYYAIEIKCTEIARHIRDTPISDETLDMLEKAGKALKTYNEIKNTLKEVLFSRIEKGEKTTVGAGKKLSYMEKFYQKKDVETGTKTAAGV